MTLEQKRAAVAFGHVEAVGREFPAGSPQRSQYGAFASKLPALLRSAGLCQAVHFLRSRDKDVANRLLDHLAQQLRRVDPQIPAEGSGGERAAALCARVREAELPSYLWLSREAVAVATWYARLAKSELGYLPGEDAEG
jgi:CRISPR/Cas system CMR-associated protein Cmr5 small subunit